MINGSEPSDALQRKSWEWLESYVVKKATCCVFTTERAAELYRSRYPESAGKIRVIENGYDEDAFVGVSPSRRGIGEDVLLFLHSGIIYPKERNPRAFFDAVSQLLSSGRLHRSKLCIRFRAPHHVKEVAALASEYGLSDVVDVAPSIPYREAIAEMLGADFLLVFQGPQFNAQIPAKIYEYLRAMRPVLALVDHRGDTASLLRAFRSPVLANIDDAEEIRSAMNKCVKLRGDITSQEALVHDGVSVKRYSRAAQTQVLSELFDTL
jgi:glycosyltransferase involved in cell wall biosynthesis